MLHIKKCINISLPPCIKTWRWLVEWLSDRLQLLSYWEGAEGGFLKLKGRLQPQVCTGVGPTTSAGLRRRGDVWSVGMYVRCVFRLLGSVGSTFLLSPNVLPGKNGLWADVNPDYAYITSRYSPCIGTPLGFPNRSSRGNETTFPTLLPISNLGCSVKSRHPLSEAHFNAESGPSTIVWSVQGHTSSFTPSRCFW